MNTLKARFRIALHLMQRMASNLCDSHLIICQKIGNKSCETDSGNGTRLDPGTRLMQLYLC